MQTPIYKEVMEVTDIEARLSNTPLNPLTLWKEIHIAC